MDDVITLCFRYTEEDYIQAFQSHYARRWRLLIDLTVLCVTASSGAYLLRDPGTHFLGLACLAIAALFALMLVAAMVVVPRLIFRRELKFREEYTLSFSPEEIRFRTAKIDSLLQWGLYTSALIGARSYVLYHGKNSMTVIPKRVFEQARQAEQFEQLLTAKISKITRSWK
jgi:hypothetical protein